MNHPVLDIIPASNRTAKNDRNGDSSDLEAGNFKHTDVDNATDETRTNNKLFLDMLELTSVVPKRNHPCLKKVLDDGRKVCVCNSTYCDNVPTVELTEPYQACIISSSLRRFGFLNKQFAKFAYRRRTNTIKNEILIKVNSQQIYQKIIGFGGTFSLAYTLGNVPIGSNLFSTAVYSYDEFVDDFNLRGFNLTEEDFELKIPYVKDALRLSNDKLKLFATPWSPPQWMLESNHDRQLRNDTKYYTAYAKYLLRKQKTLRFLEEYSKNNISFWGVTVQNRPESEEKRQHYMYYTPEIQREFVNNYLGPTLKNSTVGKNVAIIGFNDLLELLPKWIKGLFGDNFGKADDYIKGIGVHGYRFNGAHPEYKFISQAVEKYPEKFVLSTEGSNQLSKTSLGNWTNDELSLAHDIIQNLVHGMSGWTDSNLCLDLEGGPRLVEAAYDTPIIVNATCDCFYKQPIYYVIAHFSRYITPGSVRIHTLVRNASDDIQSVAFITPSKQKVLVVLNQANKQYRPKIDDMSIRGKSLKILLEPYSLTTVIWNDITKSRLKH
uniref:Glucosylceramidase n=1 Tax=Syphacia muris TaxID=451379 RepID=A0A0N5B0T6_9BILA